MEGLRRGLRAVLRRVFGLLFRVLILPAGVATGLHLLNSPYMASRFQVAVGKEQVASVHPVFFAAGLVPGRRSSAPAADDSTGSLWLQKLWARIQQARAEVAEMARENQPQWIAEASRSAARESAAASRSISHTISPAPVERSGKSPVRRLRGPLQRGEASFYGKRWSGRKTASGEIYNHELLTAAHKTLPFGTLVRVVRRDNGKEVVVRINDRGPFKKGRIIDLSTAGARRLDMVDDGIAPVELYPANLADFLRQFESPQ